MFDTVALFTKFCIICRGPSRAARLRFIKMQICRKTHVGAPRREIRSIAREFVPSMERRDVREYMNVLYVYI